MKKSLVVSAFFLGTVVMCRHLAFRMYEMPEHGNNQRWAVLAMLFAYACVIGFAVQAWRRYNRS